MNHERVCVNKTVALIAGIVMILGAIVMLTNFVSTQNMGTNSRASGENLVKTACSVVPSGSSDVYVYSKVQDGMTKYFKDEMGRVEITEGFGNYCKKATAAYNPDTGTCSQRAGILVPLKTNNPAGIVDLCEDIGPGYSSVTASDATATKFCCVSKKVPTSQPANATKCANADSYWNSGYNCKNDCLIELKKITPSTVSATCEECYVGADPMPKRQCAELNSVKRCTSSNPYAALDTCSVLAPTPAGTSGYTCKSCVRGVQVMYEMSNQ